MADRGGVLGDVALDHPIWSPFRGGGSAALGGPRFYRYPRIIPDSGAQILARFDDGTPALVERQDGAGHVLLTAIPLDTTSGDFPLQPAYLPFLRDAAMYVAGQTDRAAVAHHRGSVDPARGGARPGDPFAVGQRAPHRSATRRRCAVAGGGGLLHASTTGRPSGDPVTTIAVNPPARESDLTPMPARDLLLGVGQDTLSASQQATITLSEAERRQRIWRILLELAAAVLLMETIVAALGWRGTAAKFIGAAPERT